MPIEALEIGTTEQGSPPAPLQPWYTRVPRISATSAFAAFVATACVVVIIVRSGVSEETSNVSAVKLSDVDWEYLLGTHSSAHVQDTGVCVSENGLRLPSIGFSTANSTGCKKLRAGCTDLILRDKAPEMNGNANCTSALKSINNSQGLFGAFVPICNKDGSYAARQCSASTGYCWCSDAAGVANGGTERGPAEVKFAEDDCSSMLDICKEHSKCEQASLEARNSGLLGAAVPSCDADGSYAPLQCHSSTGFCRCVTTTGQFLMDATRKEHVSTERCTNLREGCADLAVSKHVSNKHSRDDCTKRRAAIMNRSRRLFGVFVPKCAADGSYAPRQCLASSGYCWCSTAVGNKINGTTRGRTDVSFDEEDCAGMKEACVPVLSTCELMATASANALKGAFTPKCNEDGIFAAAQCNGSTGQCWCVDSGGLEFPATRGRAGSEKLAHCEQLRTQCSSDKSSTSNGQKVEDCDDGACWCVTKGGAAFLTTNSTRSNVSSESAAHTKLCRDLSVRCGGCAAWGGVTCTRQHQSQGINCAVGSCITKLDVGKLDVGNDTQVV